LKYNAEAEGRSGLVLEKLGIERDLVGKPLAQD
jgi:hypothetical protein